MTMKLHTNTFSANGRKPESIIGYLGLDVAIHQVNIMAGEQRKPEFLALNPNGRIPVLEDGNFVLWESNAICIYLASLKPEAGLVPADRKEHADMARWLFWQSSHLGPAVGKLLMEKLFKPMRGGTPDAAVVEQGEKDLDKILAVLDQQLAGKDYVCGKLTVADFCLGPWVDTAPAIQVSIDGHANVKAWLERLYALPGFVRQPKFG